MHDSENRRSNAKSSHTPCGNVIASVAEDLVRLADILAKLSSQQLDLNRQQLDCIVRANEAIARGIHLSNCLSPGR